MWNQAVYFIIIHTLQLCDFQNTVLHRVSKQTNCHGEKALFFYSYFSLPLNLHFWKTIFKLLNCKREKQHCSQSFAFL